MADYIDRISLDNDLGAIYKKVCTNEISYDKAYVETLNLIYNAPSVDAIKVIRCKDCKFYLNQHDGHPCCDLHLDFWVDEDDYCKWGEKNEC